MRKLFSLAVCAMLAALVAGTANASDLRGRVAVTGRVGVINPANSELDVPGVGTLVVKTDAGFIGGGGLLFGVDDNIAAELDITRSSFHAGTYGDADVTNLSIGAQYRLPERQRLVPYFGAGMNVLINDLPHNTSETVLGLHVAAGIDYFLQRQIALTAEVNGVEAFSADVKNFNGTKIGSFDPSNLSFTVGARFFFN
ncbi:outer membrane protein [Geomonas silvestris]|uniref:Outer membrane protein n=1 Tax=Geomonas silvestris TaxID=2740184 RepID=A0A6V8MIC6_9BACT|nr:outer membrane beta-barrel protein [Geomonas silvestris]GFO59770.1 outer membrane protein [Geomonas silvestris]